jgi:hypothetical protein
MLDIFTVKGPSPTPSSLEDCVVSVDRLLEQSPALGHPSTPRISWCREQEAQLRKELSEAQYAEAQESSSAATGIKFHNKSSFCVDLIWGTGTRALRSYGGNEGYQTHVGSQFQIKTAAMGKENALDYTVDSCGSHHVFIVDFERNTHATVSPPRAVASPATATDRLLFAPGSSGYWRTDADFPFHSAVWSRAAESMRVEAYDRTIKTQGRQEALCTALRQHTPAAAIGHSEGAARLLQCAAVGQLCCSTLVLVSPAYSTHDLGAVDIASAIADLCARKVTVLLIDTDVGYAGSDPRFQWKERVEFYRALHDKRFGCKSGRQFLPESDHQLQDMNCAEKAVENVWDVLSAV